MIFAEAQTTGTGDGQIRAALRGLLASKHEDDPDTLILDELAIWGGEIRADLAVLNGCMHGFEIKSDADTLKRLPRQVEAYNAVFERATLVVSPRHLDRAVTLIPGWWGIIAVESIGEGIELKPLRAEQVNPSPEADAIAAFLWRQEALTILESLGLAAGVRTKSMSVLIQRIAQNLAARDIAPLVRQALRARGDWKAGARRKRYDETSQQLAIARGCRSGYPLRNRK
jgi:hypothetical protein